MLIRLACLVLGLVSVYGGCPNHCNGNGYCNEYDQCHCNRGIDGYTQWIGADCSKRTCPMGYAWVGSVVSANNVHPYTECSNKGTCDREMGVCVCYENYEGLACEKSVCPNDCNNRGICYTSKQIAEEAGATYDAPWDAEKNMGCICDAGFRGYDCGLVECPSGPDVMHGFGNEAGRDCSGRGICDYTTGKCNCFNGYYGASCGYQMANLFS